LNFFNLEKISDGQLVMLTSHEQLVETVLHMSVNSMAYSILVLIKSYGKYKF